MWPGSVSFRWMWVLERYFVLEEETDFESGPDPIIHIHFDRYRQLFLFSSKKVNFGYCYHLNLVMSLKILILKRKWCRRKYRLDPNRPNCLRSDRFLSHFLIMLWMDTVKKNIYILPGLQACTQVEISLLQETAQKLCMKHKYSVLKKSHHALEVKSKFVKIG